MVKRFRQMYTKLTDYYIKAKSLKTGNIDSSVSSNKIEINNKLTPKLNDFQTKFNSLNSKYAALLSSNNN